MLSTLLKKIECKCLIGVADHCRGDISMLSGGVV